MNGPCHGLSWMFGLCISAYGLNPVLVPFALSCRLYLLSSLCWLLVRHSLASPTPASFVRCFSAFPFFDTAACRQSPPGWPFFCTVSFHRNNVKARPTLLVSLRRFFSNPFSKVDPAPGGKCNHPPPPPNHVFLLFPFDGKSLELIDPSFFFLRHFAGLLARVIHSQLVWCLYFPLPLDEWVVAEISHSLRASDFSCPFLAQVHLPILFFHPQKGPTMSFFSRMGISFSSAPICRQKGQSSVGTGFLGAVVSTLGPLSPYPAPDGFLSLHSLIFLVLGDV